MRLGTDIVRFLNQLDLMIVLNDPGHIHGRLQGRGIDEFGG